MGSILSTTMQQAETRSRKYHPRALKRGYDWQQYLAHTVRIIGQDAFTDDGGFSVSAMKAEYANWEGQMKAVINTRARHLGLGVRGIVSQLIEEPNESKILELAIWKARNAAYAWACWTVLLGPVRSSLVRPALLPIFGFWPRDAKMRGLVPDMFDATVLSTLEQGDAQ